MGHVVVGMQEVVHGRARSSCGPSLAPPKLVILEVLLPSCMSLCRANGSGCCCSCCSAAAGAGAGETQQAIGPAAAEAAAAVPTTVAAAFGRMYANVLICTAADGGGGVGAADAASLRTACVITASVCDSAGLAGCTIDEADECLMGCNCSAMLHRVAASPTCHSCCCCLQSCTLPAPVPPPAPAPAATAAGAAAAGTKTCRGCSPSIPWALNRAAAFDVATMASAGAAAAAAATICRSGPISRYLGRL